MLKRALFLGWVYFCVMGFIPIAQAFQEADGFDYPIGDKYRPTKEIDGDDWYNPNPFEGIYPEKSVCMHSGDDWNTEPSSTIQEIGQPLKVIGHGRVVRTTTSLGGVGYDIGGGLMVEHQYKGKTYCSTYEHVEPSVGSLQDVTRGQTVARIQAITKFSPHGHVSMREGACPLTGGWYPNSGGSNCLPGYYDTIDKMNSDHLINPTRFIDENRVATWHPNGTLIRASGDATVYYIQNGLRRGIVSAEAFAKMGFSEDEVIVVSPQERDCYDPGETITTFTDPASLWPSVWNGYPEGTLVQFTGVTTPERVYLTSGGFLHWLNMSWNDFISLGYRGDKIRTLDASHVRGEIFGEDYFVSRFKECENKSVSLSLGGMGGGFEDVPAFVFGSPADMPSDYDYVSEGGRQFNVREQFSDILISSDGMLRNQRLSRLTQLT